MWPVLPYHWQHDKWEKHCWCAGPGPQPTPGSQRPPRVLPLRHCKRVTRGHGQRARACWASSAHRHQHLLRARKRMRVLGVFFVVCKSTQLLKSILPGRWSVAQTPRSISALFSHFQVRKRSVGTLYTLMNIFWWWGVGDFKLCPNQVFSPKNNTSVVKMH